MENDAMSNIKEKAIRIILFFIFGIFSGFLAKYVDTIPSNGAIGSLINIISNISSRIGIWVFIATIIAAWSRTPKAGAVHVFAFFVGMLLAYYIYSMKIFNFFPLYYFIRWGLIALVSPLAAYAFWFSRGSGWFAALCTALPIGLLVSEGYNFLYTFSPVSGFYLIAAIILFCTLPKNKYQYLKVLIFTILTSVLLSKFDVLSYIIGGL
jgi:hypothetical protein